MLALPAAAEHALTAGAGAKAAARLGSALPLWQRSRRTLWANSQLARNVDLRRRPLPSFRCGRG